MLGSAAHRAARPFLTGIAALAASCPTARAQCWGETHELAPSPGGDEEHFGLGVALWGDTLAATSRLDDGAVLVYRRSGPDWNVEAKLAPTLQWEFFGTSVALGQDTLALGRAVSDTGSVEVFARSGTSWTRQAVLASPTPSWQDDFGASLAISGDALVVGAAWDDSVDMDAGAVFVWERSGSTWTMTASLHPQGHQLGDEWGRQVAIDGDRIVATRRGGPFGPQSVVVFARSAGGAWQEEGVLLPPGGYARPESVAIRGDRAAVGDEVDELAYVFRWDGSQWVLEDQVEESHGKTGYGHRVALLEDRLLVTAPFEDHHQTQDAGSAYLYEHDGSSWTQLAVLRASEVDEAPCFGCAAALWGDTAVVGAHMDGSRHLRGGAVHVFQAADVAFCGGTPNSTGAVAGLQVDGCPSVSAGAFTLRAGPVPNAVGLFVVGEERTPLPFGNGTLCVDGARTPAAVATGNELAWTIDLAAPPYDQIVVGSTRHCQAIFRDPSGAGSAANLSDGLVLTFLP